MTERQLPLSNVEKAKERLIDIFQWLGEMRLTEILCNFNLSFLSFKLFTWSLISYSSFRENSFLSSH